MANPGTYEAWQVGSAFPSALVPDTFMPTGGSSAAFYDYPIPSEITGFEITYGSLFRRLYESPEGQHLARQDLRFAAHFGYEPRVMFAELGPDVHPLKHNLLTYMHVVDLISQQQKSTGQLLPTEEKTVALIAAGIHDMGESMHPSLIEEAGGVVGDIPYGEKTDEDRAVEAAVRNILWGKYLSDLPQSLIARVEGVISHDDEHTLAHELYETGHNLGSYRTGIAAGILALKEMLFADFLTLSPEQQIRERCLSDLAYAVIRSVSTKLAPLRSRYSAVDRTLEACANTHLSIVTAFEPMSAREEVVAPETLNRKKTFPRQVI